MFSSKELISFVFAHENDSYYGEDLMTRNLNQYLWEQLHRDHFTAVYFLRARDDEFYVSSYGDRDGDPNGGNKKGLFSYQDGWILRQLQAKPDKPVAFVCPLEDFCSVLTRGNWKKALKKIAEENKRTGIFVLTAPPTPERTANLLLTSPVFDREGLNETAVLELRGSDTPVNLYHALKDRKWDSCHFLNTYCKEQLRGIVLQHILQDPERLVAADALDRLTDYLYAWLGSPETVRGDLLPDKLPYGHYPYRTIYKALDDPATWSRFMAEGLCWSPAGIPQRNGGVAVVRDSHSYAGRCMRLTLPGWVTEDAALSQQAKAHLANIREAVCTVKNRLENPAMVRQAGKLLDQLRNTTARDGDTFLRAMDALEFCVTHIYADGHQSQILEIMGSYSDMLALSQSHYIEKRNLALEEQTRETSQLLDIQLTQTRQSVKLSADTLRMYEDLLKARKLALLNPKHTDTVANLERQIEKMQQKQADLQAEPQPQTQAPETVEELPPPEALPDTDAGQEEYLNVKGLYDIKPPIVN